MRVKIIDIQGNDTGKTVTLNKTVFEVEPNDHAIYLDVKQYLANQRQGTHKSKERGEVTGSRKKIKRQKGSGTARAGDIKNPKAPCNRCSREIGWNPRAESRRRCCRLPWHQRRSRKA